MITKITKDMLANLINEVIESGSNQKIPLPCGRYIELSFDMIENRKEIFPVCNIFLYDSQENLVKILMSTHIENGEPVTQGSIDDTFSACNLL